MSRPNRVVRSLGFKVILLCIIGALTIRIGFLLKGSLRMISGIMGVYYRCLNPLCKPWRQCYVMMNTRTPIQKEAQGP